MREELLRLENASIYREEYEVLHNINFHLFDGEAVGLLVLYGAGGTKLCDVITGYVSLDKGYLYYQGKEIVFKSAHDARQKGIFRINRKAKLVPDLSIGENLFVINNYFRLKNVPKENQLKEMTEAICKKFEFELGDKHWIWELTRCEAICVELIKAYISEAKLIVINGISLTSLEEVTVLATLIQKIVNKGCAVLWYAQSFDCLVSATERLYLIENGAILKSMEKKDYDKKTVERILYRQDKAYICPNSVQKSNVILRFFYSFGQQKKEIILHQREILGICGLTDENESQIVNRLFYEGIPYYFDGKFVSCTKVSQAMKRQMGIIFENEYLDTIFYGLSPEENLTLLLEKKWSKGLFTLPKKIKKAIWSEFIKKYGLNPDKLHQESHLKLMMLYYKWFLFQPKVLVLLHPFVSMDVKAIQIVMDAIVDISSKGGSVLILDSKVDVLKQICHKIFYEDLQQMERSTFGSDEIEFIQERNTTFGPKNSVKKMGETTEICER